MKRKLIIAALTALLAASMTSCHMGESLSYPLDFFNSTGQSSHQHDWREATCLSPACCDICGATRGKKKGHDYRVEESREATCTEEGCVVSVCSYCYDRKTETLPMVEHNLDPDDTCRVCGKNCYRDEAYMFVRREPARINLSGRIKQQCDVVDLNRFYDLDYLRECGYKNVTVTFTASVDVNRNGYQMVLLYPNSQCAEGVIHDLIKGDPNIVYAYRSSITTKTPAHKSKISFTCELALSDLPEGRIYIRYDACADDPLDLISTWQWSSANVSVTVKPS